MKKWEKPHFYELKPKRFFCFTDNKVYEWTDYESAGKTGTV